VEHVMKQPFDCYAIEDAAIPSRSANVVKQAAALCF
jgi:hypothetical protein